MLDTLIADARGPLIAFVQVVMIDLALAGDNAVAVGLAASGLPDKDRRRAIVLGLLAAMAMLVCFALVAVKLLNVVGLLLAGGVLLLWVCWKMWRDLRDHAREAEGEAALEGASVPHKALRRGQPRTLMGALATILLADLSMSLDNVLAVAGASREHPVVMVIGLVLSVTMMGVAAAWIARLLMKWRWIGYLGLAIIFYVALHMIWQGHRQVVVRLGRAASYNAAVPAFMDIGPAEIAEYSRR